MYKTGDKVVPIIDYTCFNKGTKCIVYGDPDPTSNYMCIIYLDMWKSWRAATVWKYNFKKWEVNKNIKLL